VPDLVATRIANSDGSSILVGENVRILLVEQVRVGSRKIFSNSVLISEG